MNQEQVDAFRTLLAAGVLVSRVEAHAPSDSLGFLEFHSRFRDVVLVDGRWIIEQPGAEFDATDLVQEFLKPRSVVRYHVNNARMDEIREAVESCESL